MKLYLSGPISSDTARTIDQKRERFRTATLLLEAAGYTVINPFDVGPACELDPCRHTDTMPLQSEAQDNIHTWSCFLRADLAALLTCDGVATLDGWEASSGARLECATARAVHMIIAPVNEWFISAHADTIPIGTRSQCTGCGRYLTRIPGDWTSDVTDRLGVYCAASKDPNPTHTPKE